MRKAMTGMLREYHKRVRRYLLFAPSLFFGLLGGLWLWWRPFPYESQLGPDAVLVTAGVLVGILLGGAWLLERSLPSFRHASKLMERVLSQFEITLLFAFSAALVSAVAEEVFFRGALMPYVGVWGQALLFGLLHPATRRGWSYTVFTFFAGLCFGYATLFTGSLWAAIIAHFVINFQGFLEVRAQQRRKPTIDPYKTLVMRERTILHTQDPASLSQVDSEASRES